MTIPVTKIYNPILREALTSFDDTLMQARAGIKFSNGKEVNHCNDYLKFIETSEVLDTVENRVTKKQYLICDAMGLLGKRQYTLPKIMPKIGEKMASRLDLCSFTSSLSKTSGDKLTTFVAMDGQLVVGATQVGFETDDSKISLEVVASADISNNGRADWIIWLVDEDKQGKTVRYQTLVAYDVDVPEKRIQAIAY